MNICINGVMHMIDMPLNLIELLEKEGFQQDKGFAVAINQTFIPRSLYEQTWIQAEDHIEIVMPMQGG